jgi:hypothetical protein
MYYKEIRELHVLQEKIQLFKFSNAAITLPWHTKMKLNLLKVPTFNNKKPMWEWDIYCIVDNIKC